jgi:hypothetical protein
VEPAVDDSGSRCATVSKIVFILRGERERDGGDHGGHDDSLSTHCG